MRVTIIGTGYVGLVSGACIADFGHQVTCVDKDSTKITTLNAGEIPLFEPGLGDIVRSNLEQGRLAFTTALGESVRGAARPRHHAQAEGAIEDFKKTSPRAWRQLRARRRLTATR